MGMPTPKSHHRPVAAFSIPIREEINGKTLSNKCGRDFLYFALHFYHPSVFNTDNLSPLKLDQKKLLGTSVPSWLAWTQVQFKNTAAFLA